MLHQETTHEYYMGSDPDIYYCDDHNTLIVVKDCMDRVLLGGLTKETMIKFATKLYRDDLNKTLESIKEETTKEETNVTKS